MKEYSIDKLVKVAIALTAEKDINKVMDMIVCEAMEISDCDGGTLYIKRGEFLHFDSMFTKSKGILERTLERENTLPPVPISPDYISGRSALYHERINVGNVYESSEYDFSGTKKYDRINDYKTISMLVIPMEDDHENVIGVLQLINAQDKKGNIIPFAKEYEELIYALSSLAAVALNNHLLSVKIEELLHSFVHVMVTAIDERSPYNANHTRSMADYAEKFIDYLTKTGNEWSFSDEVKDAFLMSVWLHDIGKIVVKEEVLDKPARLGKKLDRVREKLRVARLMEKIGALEDPAKRRVHEENIDKLNKAWELIEKSNEAGFLPDESVELLTEAADLLCADEEGNKIPLLDDDELESITIRKGTLTDSERKQVQDHVVYTERMLKEMSFFGVYEKVTPWASQHHEMLDGSGYPNKLKGDDISKEVRLLTVIDIYDALTAEDRPYKKPLSPEKAFDILKSMAEEGKLDKEILDLFIESKAWKRQD